MLKVGIIGAGGISAAHAIAYEALSQKAKVVGIADIREDKARELAGRFGAKSFVNGDDLLMEDVDIIDICLPTFLHEEYVVKAARAGKHVLCEKPMALSLESADKMIMATQEAGVKFMVAQCVRFWPEYMAIRERLSAGNLGTIKSITAARIGSTPAWSWNDWMLRPKLSGGASLDLHIHDIDFVNWVMGGRPETVMAVGARSRHGAIDHINTLIIYGEGKAAAVEADWLMPPGYPFTMSFRVTCENGVMEFLFKAGANIEKRNEVTQDLILYRYSGDPEVVELHDRKDPYLAEIEYFIGCIENGEFPTLVTPQDAKESLEIALAAQRSVEEGRAIEIERRCM